MIGLDTNILFSALEQKHENNVEARHFLQSLESRSDIAVSEFVLTELYGLLRNPKVVRKPLNASAAVDACHAFRTHPQWRLLGFSADSAGMHNRLWKTAAGEFFARRRIYDVRLALSLVQQGVSEFATANVKDFEGLGFSRVWNPFST